MNVKLFKISFFNERLDISFAPNEMEEVNGMGRFSEDFLNTSVMLCCISVLVNMFMLHVCYKEQKTLMNKLVAFDCFVST